MKLFAKYNRVNIAATIVVFLIGSIGFFFVLQYVLTRQLDQTLRVEQQEIAAYVKDHRALPVIENARDQWIEIKPAARPESTHFRSLTTFNPQEQETEPVRQLVFYIEVTGSWYQVTVSKSATETEDLLKLIIAVTISMIALMFVLNFVLNRTLIRRLWQPFYRTIDSIKNYRLNTELRLPDESIDEIQLLNQSLNVMSGHIHQDYQTLRSFTENASHEMQTPLSVIRSKTELLLQELEGDEKAMQQVMVIEDAALKLSRLHQSLLLLTKLKNRQYKDDEIIDLSQLIHKKLEERRELFDAKNIQVQFEPAHVLLSFHPHLAEILVANLLNNALAHTPVAGNLDIFINTDLLSVQNTASGEPLDSQKIFQRFYKANPSSEGTGLGLAIIYEICVLSGYRINYKYHNNTHDFTIYFNA